MRGLEFDCGGITLGPGDTCCQGYLDVANMYLELLEVLLEVLLQLQSTAGAAAATAAILATTCVVVKRRAIAAVAPAAAPAVQQFQVHFGKTQVPLATATLLC